VAAWRPIVPPLAWPRRPLVSFRASREALEEKLGPPQERDGDSNGMGPVDIWALHFDCGLEVMLLAFHVASDLSEVPRHEPTWVEIQANSTEFEHISAHLPLALVGVSPWLPDRRTYPPNRWALMRQDDNGGVFEVQRFSSRCAAGLALSKFEALYHKQMYWLAELNLSEVSP
jgi:hypothetical protein